MSSFAFSFTKIQLLTGIFLLPVATCAGAEKAEENDNNSAESIRPGYHFDGFRIRPSVSLMGKFDDNIFATDSAEESDFITVISPALSIDSTWDKHSLRLRFGADVGRYAEFDAENYNDYWTTLDGRYDLSSETNIFGGIGFGFEHEGRDSPDAIAGGLSPSTYQSTNAHAGIKTVQDKTTLRMGMTYEDLNFDNSLTANGSTIVNDDRDRALYGLGIRATQALDSGDQFYAQALWDARDYQQTTDQNGYYRDSDGYRLGVGFETDPKQAQSYALYLGYLNQDYDDARFDNVEAVDFSASLKLSPNPQTKISADLLRTLNETTLSGSSGYLYTSLSGKLEYKISPRLVPSLSLGYAEADYQDSGRNDETYSAEAALRYYLASNAFVTAGYRYVERDSNDFGLINSSDDYTNNIAFVTFTAQGYPVFEPYISAYTTHGEIEAGILALSDDATFFGRYSGLDSSGTHINGSLLFDSRDKDNGWAVFEGRDLGLDSRSVTFDWGAQGEYAAWLHYDQQPFTPFIGQTIFDGVGSTYLSLPTNWVRGDETGDLTALNSSLNPVTIGTMRKKIDTGASFIRKKYWTLAVEYENQSKEGFQQIAGVVGHAPGNPARAVMLPAPIDYSTNIVKASFDFARDQTALNLAYQSSFFQNNIKQVTWESPFTNVNTAPRSDLASISMAPDNHFHQLSLSGVHTLFGTTRLTGMASFSAAYQNDEFLPDTVNPDLSPNTLPRDSLDGEVYQTNALLALTSRPARGLNLKAAYRLQQRDNRTPIDTYTYHVNDTKTTSGTSSPATDSNTPYSYDKRDLELSAGYRINSMSRLSAEIARETYECDTCEVQKTTEDKGNLRLQLDINPEVQLTLRGGLSDKDGSQYQTIAGENPLLRKYNMADRERSTAGVDMSWQPTASLAFGAMLETSLDDYTETLVGLTEASSTGLTLDASYQINDALTGHAYISRELIESEQTGSQSPDSADWFVDNEDTVDSLGFGIKWHTSPKLEIGLDYTYSGVTGETDMRSLSTNPPVNQFPDIASDLHTLKLQADYQWHKNTKLRFTYLFEDYDTKDWAIDGATVDSIPEVLLMGEQNPGYQEHLVGVSIVTRF